MTTPLDDHAPQAGARRCADARPLKVLVLDDEPMILMDLVFSLEDLGAVALDARSVADALGWIEREPPDVAILDVNLGRGATCKPVAERLRAMGVPFLLHSGDLDRQGVGVASMSAPIVPKPTPGHIVIRRALDLVQREDNADR